ncbi:Rpa49 subunit specific to nuclear RNA polymerase I [Chiua virens]|nr:Rpa49 subunit specific to nuclear RNA polymerase I [Chiua virens]
MAPASTSKKRKRDDDQQKISLALSDQPKSQLGPVLVNFPAIKAPKSTSFDCYQTEKVPVNEDTHFADLPTLIAGETDVVDFFSSTESRRTSFGSRYLVAVHNKRTKTTTLREAPLHILSHQVKALKSLKPAPVSTFQRLEGRAALGDTFGTKKAKQAIRAQERNKVDVSAMEAVADHLQDIIQRNTQALPSKEEARAMADGARLVPPYNSDAETPSEIYPLHNVIPEAEWKTLSPSAIIQASTSKERTALLTYQRSKWINQHLDLVCASPSPSKTHAKILMYISIMMSFRNLTIREFKKPDVYEKLSAAPSIIIDGLMSRFTETPRGSTKPQSTSQTETLLLTHMFSLCLRVDDYATDTTLVASDLSQKLALINTLFKLMGCKINKLTVHDLKRLGLPDSAGEAKRAVLKTPLEFPKPRVKRNR